MTYYKVLNDDGTPCHGGKGRWFLPSGAAPGKWMPKIEHVELCKSGYHVVEIDYLIYWLGPAIFEVEVRGDGLDGTDKSVFPEVRLLRKIETWNERTARLFAADCAERVLHIFEKQYPADKRPRMAIAAARDFVNGKISLRELAAAWEGAKDAWLAGPEPATARGYANFPGGNAALIDAWEARDGAALRYAAWAAMVAAAPASITTEAGLAARDAVLAAAWAGRAAHNAALAAASAALAASADDAADGALHAAGAYECKWQTDRLTKYLEGLLP